MTLVQRPKSPEVKHECEHLMKLQAAAVSAAWDRRLIALGFIFSLLAGHFLALLKLLNKSLEVGTLWIQGFFWFGLCLTFLGGIWALIGWFQAFHKNFKIARH